MIFRGGYHNSVRFLFSEKCYRVCLQPPSA